MNETEADSLERTRDASRSSGKCERGKRLQQLTGVAGAGKT